MSSSTGAWTSTRPGSLLRARLPVMVRSCSRSRPCFPPCPQNRVCQVLQHQQQFTMGEFGRTLGEHTWQCALKHCATPFNTEHVAKKTPQPWEPITKTEREGGRRNHTPRSLIDTANNSRMACRDACVDELHITVHRVQRSHAYALQVAHRRKEDVSAHDRAHCL